MRPLSLALLVASSLFLPSKVRSQDVLPAVVGGALGLAGGGFVSVGIVTIQARRGHYLYSPSDALSWQATPVLLGTAAGTTIGLLSQDRLRRTVEGGALGLAMGAGLGTLFGLAVWPDPEGKWAGGVIGGAAGLLAGSVVGVLRQPSPPAGSARDSASFPIGVSLRF